MYPVQIHGIVLGVNKQSLGVIIADFGCSSKENNGECLSGDEEAFGSEYSLKSFSNNISCYDGQRFKILTLTSIKDINKWSKVNYGDSLLSKKSNNIEKMTSWFFRKTSTKQRENEKIREERMIDTDKENKIIVSNSSNYKSNKELSAKCHEDSRELESLSVASSSISHSTQLSGEGEGEGEEEERPPDSMTTLQTSSIRKKESTNSIPISLSELIENANKVDRMNRDKFSVVSINGVQGRSSQKVKNASDSKNMFTTFVENSSDVSAKHKSLVLELSKSLYHSAKFFNGIVKENNGVKEEQHEQGHKQKQEQEQEQEQQSPPKMPKSDPITIVLARVNFIMSQQDLPDKMSSLPPYHIFWFRKCL